MLIQKNVFENVVSKVVDISFGPNVFSRCKPSAQTLRIHTIKHYQNQLKFLIIWQTLLKFGLKSVVVEQNRASPLKY